MGIIGILVLILNINNLKGDILNLQTDLDNKNVEVTKLNQDFKNLNESFFETNDLFNTLTEDNIILEEDFQSLDNDYFILKQETIILLEEVNLYQEEIEESLEWYQANSELTDSTNQKSVKRKIDSNCLNIYRDQCNIKLGCFYLINSEKLDLEYKYDEFLYGQEDKLSSITEFLDNKGGDCEDYALFFKAEYNYALSQCNGKEIILEGWRYPNKEDNEIKYWLNFQKNWYIDDVVRVDISNYIFPNIICGNLYDPILDDISGHCMIAFTTKKIESIMDLRYLDNSYIIEPQDGSFLGNLNRPNSAIYLLDEEKWFDDSINSWVSSVITDNDYFLFSERDLNWKSYTSFKDLLHQKTNQINNILIFN